MTEYHCKYDELVDPSQLIDHPRNVNKHPRRQLDALSAVIWGPKFPDGTRNSSKALGWRHAIVVSRRSGFVTMGHARKTVGIEEGELVPVVYQDFESDAAERAMLRADNRLAELAEIDFELEQIEIKELAALDIPVLDFGFEIAEVINRETDDRGETGSSPWDRAGEASSGVMFSFGDFQCRVSEEAYCRFKQEVNRDNLEEWILENCNR